MGLSASSLSPARRERAGDPTFYMPPRPAVPARLANLVLRDDWEILAK